MVVPPEQDYGLSGSLLTEFLWSVATLGGTQIDIFFDYCILLWVYMLRGIQKDYYRTTSNVS